MHYSANFKVKGCNSFNTFWSIESYWTKQRCEPGVKLSTTQNSVKITPVNSDPESQCPLLPLNGPSSGWLLVSTLHFSHKEYCQFFKTLLWDYNIGFYIKGKPYFNRATVNCISPPQGDYDGRGQRTASPMLTAFMSGGVGISGRELSTQLINSLEQANHSFS